MGKKELSKRNVWQDVSSGKSVTAEKRFYDIFSEEFSGTHFHIRPKPKELRDVYGDVVLSKKVLRDIYNPNEKWRHGVIPDYAIDNLKTKKTLYVEVKRQDGWVEGKSRSAGRGNAHERSCKFFTPGLLKILRKCGNIKKVGVLPFWVVFQGDIARDPKRVREITCWYGEYSDHFFMWSDFSDKKALISHFDRKLKRVLS